MSVQQKNRKHFEDRDRRDEKRFTIHGNTCGGTKLEYVQNGDRWFAICTVCGQWL